MSQPDKVVVKGLPPLDGEYPFDIFAMALTPGDPDFMTFREWHEFQKLSEVTAGEVASELDRGNTSANLGLIATVLRRAGRVFDVDDLWDAPGTAEIRLVIDWQARAKPKADDADPPVSEPPASDASGNSSDPGGESSRLTLASPANDPSPTGVLNTAISGRATSVR